MQQKLTEIAKLAVKYGPAVVEALAWLWTAVLRWLDGSADEDQVRVADVLPRPLLSRLEMLRGRAAAEAIVAEEMEAAPIVVTAVTGTTALVAMLRPLIDADVVGMGARERLALEELLDRVERGE